MSNQITRIVVNLIHQGIDVPELMDYLKQQDVEAVANGEAIVQAEYEEAMEEYENTRHGYPDCWDDGSSRW